MKEILYNDDNLREYEINERVVRTKALIINSNNQILLGYSYKTYQFPGGHLEGRENIVDCIFREIREETGIVLTDKDIAPFMVIKKYMKNYRDSGFNRENDIYYFLIKTDENIDLSNVHYDRVEQLGHYELVRVDLDEVEALLMESIEDNPVNKYIVEEMLEVFNELKRLEKEKEESDDDDSNR